MTMAQLRDEVKKSQTNLDGCMTASTKRMHAAEDAGDPEKQLAAEGLWSRANAAYILSVQSEVQEIDDADELKRLIKAFKDQNKILKEENKKVAKLTNKINAASAAVKA